MAKMEQTHEAAIPQLSRIVTLLVRPRDILFASLGLRGITLRTCRLTFATILVNRAWYAQCAAAWENSFRVLLLDGGASCRIEKILSGSDKSWATALRCKSLHEQSRTHPSNSKRRNCRGRDSTLGTGLDK